MAKKDVSQEMKDLEKKANLPKEEKIINVYSKVKVKALAAKNNPLKAGQTYEVHPEHVEHLKEKGFVEEIKGESVKTEVPNLDEAKTDTIIQA